MESLLDSIKEQYPTMTPEEHKELGKLALGWVTLLGTTSVKRLENAKLTNTEHLEERAQYVALRVMLDVFHLKLKDEVTPLFAIAEKIQNLDTIPGTEQVA